MRSHFSYASSRSFRAVLLLVLAASPLLATSPRRDPDKIRLQASDAPDPVSIPAQQSTLAAQVFVRKVAGLAAGDADDDDDCDDDRRGSKRHGKRFYVRLAWRIRTGPTAVVEIEREVEVHPPYSIVRLETRGKKRLPFVAVPVSLVWSGRDAAGAFVPAGTYAYEAVASFVRVHDHGWQRERTIDEAVPVAGTVTVQRPPVGPAAPTVNPVASLTNRPVLELSGGKPSGTALLVNGVEHVPADAATTWNTTKSLFEGFNTVELRARDAAGAQSAAVTVGVTLDTIPPASPQTVTPPTDVLTSRITLTGTKQPDTAVLINGVIVVPRNGGTTWSAEITLQPGDNTIIVETQDAAGNRSITQGGVVAGVAKSKPVIGGLTASPAVAPTGQPVAVDFRLFAEAQPAENADLDVTVTVEDGDQLVRTLFRGVLAGSPTGTARSVTWDQRDDAGQLVAVNTSYRIMVTAVRASPTTQPRALVDANPKQTAVVVTGSQRVRAPDGKLEVVFRPDDASMKIESRSPLAVTAAAALTRRRIRVVGGPYRIAVDRPFTSPVVGLWTHPGPAAPLLRPYEWSERQQDWTPIARANWNPTARSLSFALSGAGTMLIGSSPDVEPPRVEVVDRQAGSLTIDVRDSGSGVQVDRIRCRAGRDDRSASVKVDRSRGIRSVRLTVPDPPPAGLRVYVEDLAGNSRAYELPGRTP